MGYIPRLDIRAGKVKAQWTPRPKWGGIRQLIFNGNADYYENHAGLVDSRTQNVYGNMRGRTRRALFVGVDPRVRQPDGAVRDGRDDAAGGPVPVDYATIELHLGPHQAGLWIGRRPISAATTAAIDRACAPASTSRSARRCCSSRTTRTTACTLPGRPLYSSNVLNFRVSHSFSPDFYLKGFVQYNDDRKTASFNFLWWYHYKPGSDLYVVYNQGWDTDLPLTSREMLDQSHRVRIAIARRQDDVLAGSIAASSMRRACGGPQLPGSYSWTGASVLSTGSTICHVRRIPSKLPNNV